MAPDEDRQFSRFGLELLGAAFAIGFGISVVHGALEHPVGWGNDGPQPGTLPFWLGVIVIGAGLFILGQAMVARGLLRREAVLDGAAVLRLARFGLPVVLFVALVMPLGIYVAMGIYLFGMVLWQGHGWKAAVFTAVAAIAFSWVAFEYWFALPLPKGPVEALFGIY